MLKGVLLLQFWIIISLSCIRFQSCLNFHETCILSVEVNSHFSHVDLMNFSEVMSVQSFLFLCQETYPATRHKDLLHHMFMHCDVIISNSSLVLIFLGQTCYILYLSIVMESYHTIIYLLAFQVFGLCVWNDSQVMLRRYIKDMY